MASKEATARIKINKLLEVAGWRFFADGKSPANIQFEPSITIRPRGQNGSVEPILMPKHERRFTGFDDKIVAIYAWHDHAENPRLLVGVLWR